MHLSLCAMYVHGKPFHVIARIVWIKFFDRVSEQLIRALTWVLRKRRPNVGISMFQPNWKTNPQQCWSLGATIVSRNARPSRIKFNEINTFIPVYTAAAIHLRQGTHKNTAVCKDNNIYTYDTMQYKADCDAVTGNHVTLSATIQLMLIYVGVCQTLIAVTALAWIEWHWSASTGLAGLLLVRLWFCVLEIILFWWKNE